MFRVEYPIFIVIGPLIRFMLGIMIVGILGFSCQTDLQPFKEMKAEVSVLTPTSHQVFYTLHPEFEWQAVPEAASYHLYINEWKLDELVASLSSSATLTWILPEYESIHWSQDDEDYWYFMVRAQNAFQYSNSPVHPFYLANPAPVLLEPVADILLCPTDNSISFQWNTVLGKDTYRIQLAMDHTFDEILVDEVLTSTSYEWNNPFDAGLITLFWRVMVEDSNDEFPFSDSSVFRIEQVPPVSHIEFDLLDAACQSHFLWEVPVYTRAYEIEVFDQADTSVTPLVTDIITEPAFSFQEQQTGQYFFRVRNQGEACASSWSELQPFVHNFDGDVPPYAMPCERVDYDLEDVPIEPSMLVAVFDNNNNLLQTSDTLSNPNVFVSAKVKEPYCGLNFNGILVAYMNQVEVEAPWEFNDSDEVKTSRSIHLTVPLGDNQINIVAVLILRYNGTTFVPYRRSEIYQLTGTFDTPTVQAQLAWNNPVDLDLAMSGPNNEPCFYAAPNRIVPLGNGSQLQLDADNQKGYGPENITLVGEPVEGTYAIWVNYFAGTVPVQGIVRVWKDGTWLFGKCHDFTTAEVNGILVTNFQVINHLSWQVEMQLTLP
jgi:hypothetical protein